MSFSPKATRRILSSTAAAAIIWGSGSAHAQNSYDAGDPTVVSGNVTFDRTGTANTEIYTINSNTAVLDFVPNDTGPGGPINFQAAGTEAQYRGGLAITDFTVLNRILANDPSRAIQFDGSVISRLQASPTTPGGSVWFYSPGGIIIGSSAVFDVGNLLLAAGDPTGGSGIIADPNQFSINSVPDSNAAITVQAGAQISATNPGSYVALVAPAIVQSGTVSTNGSAAYVAAEQTTLTFSSGLFNIQTTVGSNANNSTPLVHDGTTRFVDDAGQRRAYLVSVAKNDAITMLIEGAGQLGFDMATGVNIDNGVVVLSGGYDVNDTTYTNLAGSAGALRHDIQITNPTNNANFQGQVNPFAASEIRINALNQPMFFAGDVSMNAGSLASIVSGLNSSIIIGGDLDLSTLVHGARDVNFAGGNVVVDASLGDIFVDGSTSLTSFTNADFLGGMDPAGTVQGGTILIATDNGNTFQTIGNLDILVEANGANQLLTSQTSAGNAIGGNIILASSGLSGISVGGAANIVSTATGGTVQLGDATAGNATGGTTNILAGDGDITFAGNLTVSATGNGGQVNASGTTAAGDGTGGQININVGTANFSVGGNLNANVRGTGGNTQFATSRNGGNGSGGAIAMSVLGTGNIDVGNTLILNADGQGTSAVGGGNSGGNGAGGDIQVLAQGGDINLNGLTFLRAIGTAGAGADNTGIFARGGNLEFQAGGGNIRTFAQLALTADAFTATPGAGQDGADGFGGSSVVSAINGGNIAIDGTAIITAAGNGSDANGGITGLAGNGLGGNSQIVATSNGVIGITGAATVNSQAIGGNGLVSGTDGGDGTGGTASISQGTGGFVQIDGSADVFADGTGGINRGGGDSIGGTGQGGDARLFSNDGSIIVGQARVGAGGIGGATDGGIAGGNGIGGLANIEADTGLTRVIGNTIMTSSGVGGGALSAGANGGDGTGGQSLIGTIGTGTIDLQGTVTFDDSSIGGSAASGVGGNGTAGLSQILTTAGTVDIGGFVNFNTEGTGGSGLNGGIGTGGRASVFADSAGTINFANQVTMSARGRGGQSDGIGNKGGFGQGGTAEIFAHGTINIVGNYLANSGGIGGSGANDADGGDALGGVGSILADGGVIRFDSTALTRGTTNGGTIISGTGSGGDAQGGLAQMIARNGGNLQILGVSGFDANVATSGFGGDGLFGSGSGGNGIGGTSNVFAESGGTIDIAGFLLATASGFGGQDFFDPSLQYADLGGNGTGGTVSILANGGNIIGTSSVSALANGHGGLGVVEGGTATGGTVNVIAIDGLLDFSSGTDEMFLSMTGVGGDAVPETDGAGTVLRGGGSGGDGIGGNVFLLAGLGAPSNGLTGIVRAGDIRISENAAAPQGLSAVGGAGAAGAAGQGGGDGGDATGGVIFIGTNNENGVFQVGNVTMGSLANAGAGGLGGLADGSGIFGNGGDGGDAFGRSIGLGAYTDIGASTTGSAQFGDIVVNMAANGGNGGNAQGGNAIGGTGGDALEGPPATFGPLSGAYIITRSMPLTLGDAMLTANATGGDGGLDAGGARSAGGIAEGFATSISASFGFTDNQGRGSLVGNDYIGRAISIGGLGAGDVRANSFMGASGLSGLVGDVQLNTALLETRGIQQRTDIDPNEFAPYAFVAAIDGIVTVDGDVVMLSDNEFNLLPIGAGEINIGGNLNVTAGAGNSQAQSPFGDPADEINVDGNVSLALGGDLVFDADIDVPGDFNATAGGVIQATNITAGSGITLQAGSTISTGNLLATNDISLTGMADEQLGLPANIVTGNITTQTGLINVVTNIGDITLGNLASPAAILINAGNGSTNANAGGDIIVGTVQGSDLNISGTDNLTIGDSSVVGTSALNLVGTINAGNMTTGIDAILMSGSSIQTQGLTAGGQINLNAMNQIVVAGGISAGTLLNVATFGPITTQAINAGGFVRMVSGDQSQYLNGATITTGAIVTTSGVNIRATGDIMIDSIDAQFGLNLFGRSNISTGDLALGRTVQIGTEGDLNLGSVSSITGPVNLGATGTITAGALFSGAALSVIGEMGVNLLGDVEGVQSVAVTTAGLASFAGLVDSPNINVTSTDINFGTNGGLGSTNTNDLEINAIADDQPIIFGGDGSGGGYNLSATEATRLRSRTIRFNAQPISGMGPVDLTIADFTMQGSLAGANANLLASDLLINSPGNIRVTGAIRIENAGVEDSLGLSAESGRIEVVTDLGGSIAIADDGGLAGNLFLDANHIAVGTSDLLARLATDPRFAGRDAEVNTPDGSNRPEGYISAGSIQVDGFETIMIQNSGTETLRGGFSAGSGGFILDTENTTTGGVDAVVNGRIADDTGSFLTNDATLPAVGFEDPAEAALFSGGSQINGCVLNSGGCQIVTPTTPNQSEQPITIASDVREIIHEQGEASDSEDDDDQRAAELTPASTGKKSPIAPNIPVVNTNRLNSSPAVTDPITGSGNPNFISGELEIDLDPSPSLTDNGDS